MSRTAFRAWAEALPHGRYERLDGRPVAKDLEKIAHNLVKLAVWMTFREAARQASVPCWAFGDGVTIEVGEHTDYEPDAILNLGGPLDEDRYDAPVPFAIAEVISPSTSRIERGRKLRDYFSLPSVQHYLIVEARERRVLYYHRAGDDTAMRTVQRDGTITLDPLGIRLEVRQFFADLV